MRLICLLPVAAIALLACEPLTLEAVSAPPSTGVAELDANEEVIRVSDGVAIAVACTSRLCNDATASIGNKNVAMVRKTSTDYLRDEFRDGDQPAVIFVVVGLSEGTTELTVTSPEADVTFDIEVLRR